MGEYNDNVEEILLEYGPMTTFEIADKVDAESYYEVHARKTVNADSRFVFGDDGRVHLTTQNGET